MSVILLDHPVDWIGVPESWPNERWSVPSEWIDELLRELAQANREAWGEPTPAELEALTGLFLGVVDLARAHGARGYVTMDGWSGLLNVAELMIIPSELLGDLTVRDVAGDQNGAVEKPIVEDFTTESGLVGVCSVRFEQVEAFGGIMARADYLWPIAEGALRLYTSSADLISFERVLPRLAKLAATVTVHQTV